MAKADLKKKVVLDIPTTEEEKKKALQSAIAHITKVYGTGAIMRLGENKANLNVEAIPTGSMMLDMALGIGGVPRGRIVELYGPESSGKTTVALHIIAEAQKMGGEVAFIDVEHALDPTYAEALGVNIDSLLVSQPDSGEQALEIAEALIRSGALDIVVVDSVAALVPRAEIEGEMGDSHVGLQARLMSQAMRKLAGAVSKSNCIAIFINQLRLKVGVVYGNPEVTAGRQRAEILRVRPAGRAPHRNAEGRIGSHRRPYPGEGGQKQGGPALQGGGVRYHVRRRHLQGRGAAGSGGQAGHRAEVGRLVLLQGGAAGQGRDNVKELFKGNPELTAEIEALVRANLDKLNPSRTKTNREPVEIPLAAAAKMSAPAAKAAIDIVVDDE